MNLLDPENDFKQADLDNALLRKILGRLTTVVEAIETTSPTVTIEPGNVNIGSIQIKDALGPELADVETVAPTAGKSGLVVRNIPSGTQTVTGTVDVGNLPATQPVSGTVGVNNFPATQPVSGTVAVTGTVGVNNFPATQPVSGSVSVSNLPVTQPVSGTVAVTGTVGVNNFPATQPVSGTVAVTGTVGVNNFPATQPVSGTVAVTGTVGVNNFPATQPVSGTVAVSNFPTTLEEFGPVYSAAVLGQINGKTAEVFHVMGRRAGFNSTSVLQDVGEWLGTGIDTLPELTGAENLEVVSSSASDTNTAGTGARTIRVGYIDTSNNLVVSTDIALNGTTAVALAFKANFILWMEVTATGSNNVSVGNVILRIAGAGTTHEQISAGGNRSLSCRFMVPTGYTGYLIDWSQWAIGTTQDLRLRATVRTRSRTLGTAYVFQSIAYLAGGGTGSEELPYFKCPALSKIKVSTVSGATGNTNRLDCEFTILLIAN